MADLIKASAKAIKTFIGPVAFPIDFFLSICDDEKTKDFENRIIKEIQAGHNLTKTFLEQILEIKKDIKVIKDQYISGIVQCSAPIRDYASGSVSEENLESHLTQWLSQNGKRLSGRGPLTQVDVLDELVKIYGPRIDHFKALIRPVGFEITNLPISEDARYIFDGFVQTCDPNKMSTWTIERCFKAFYKDTQHANHVFKICTAIWHEYNRCGQTHCEQSTVLTKDKPHVGKTSDILQEENGVPWIENINKCKIMIRPVLVGLGSNLSYGNIAKEIAPKIFDEAKKIFEKARGFMKPSIFKINLKQMKIDDNLVPVDGCYRPRNTKEFASLWELETSDLPGERGSTFQFLIADFLIKWPENNHGILYNTELSKDAIPGRHALLSINQKIVGEYISDKRAEDEYNCIRALLFLVRNLYRSLGGIKAELHERYDESHRYCLMYNPGNKPLDTYNWIMDINSHGLKFKLCNECENEWKQAASGSDPNAKITRKTVNYMDRVLSVLETKRDTLKNSIM